ncbi:MAG: type II toxin-antitoxin system Phd/YefM family antitoxin [Planctomycetes bacterium]|nr:type II toxin-antitoxin system Phd/YefM family antitoxin [Planctomycetota bacterium]
MFQLDATKARARYSELLSRVQFGGERILLQRSGKPAVALVPVEDLALLESTADLFALQDALERLEKAIGRKGGKIPRSLARARETLEALEDRHAVAASKRAEAEMEANGGKPIPWEDVKRRAGL